MTYTFTNLNPANSYTVKIKWQKSCIAPQVGGLNPRGGGSITLDYSSTYGADLDYPSPRNLSITNVGYRGFTANWQQAATCTSGITGYQVRLLNANNTAVTGWIDKSASARKHEFEELSGCDAETYKVEVRAKYTGYQTPGTRSSQFSIVAGEVIVGDTWDTEEAFVLRNADKSVDVRLSSHIFYYGIDNVSFDIFHTGNGQNQFIRSESFDLTQYPMIYGGPGEFDEYQNIKISGLDEGKKYKVVLTKGCDIDLEDVPGNSAEFSEDESYSLIKNIEILSSSYQSNGQIYVNYILKDGFGNPLPFLAENGRKLKIERVNSTTGPLYLYRDYSLESNQQVTFPNLEGHETRFRMSINYYGPELWQQFNADFVVPL